MTKYKNSRIHNDKTQIRQIHINKKKMRQNTNATIYKCTKQICNKIQKDEKIKADKKQKSKFQVTRNTE